MNHFFIILFFIIFSGFHSLSAQNFIITQDEMRHSSYEDLSDFLRRYPGMYPLDYGTLGAPILFRPWNLNPWEFQVDKDGIPQNRIYDGLYDSNLQPAIELDSINYDFLSRGAAGRFSLTTRILPTEKPYTEFLVREGFYGYGTVDFSHGQRVYKSATLEFTGRLAWYNGFLDSTASKFNRLRGKLSFNLSKKWRTDLTYAGSNTDTDFPENGTNLNPYSEREEGIISIIERDSARTIFSPSLKLYARQDRERWSSGFKAREEVYGYVLSAHAKLRDQNLSFRQLTSWAKIGFPGLPHNSNELSLKVEALDSIYLKLLSLKIESSLANSVVNDMDTKPTVDFNASFQTKSISAISMIGGIGYAESQVPISWLRGTYRISERPLLIDPEFTISHEFVNNATHRESDDYLKSIWGLQWRKEKTLCAINLIAIDPVGKEGNNFSQTDPIELRQEKMLERKSIVGLSGNIYIPLKYGFYLDSHCFTQLKSDRLLESADARSYSRLCFQRDYFRSPLTVRSYISHEYFGNRAAYSDKSGIVELPYANVFGFRVSATIKGVTLIWGMENIFSEDYEILPGYPRIGKEEYLSLNWQLWL